jgi:hypothetical protein
MTNANAFRPPVVVAASAYLPSWATINASVKPITARVAGASTIGQARRSSVLQPTSGDVLAFGAVLSLTGKAS